MFSLFWSIFPQKYSDGDGKIEWIGESYKYFSGNLVNTYRGSSPLGRRGRSCCPPGPVSCWLCGTRSRRRLAPPTITTSKQGQWSEWSRNKPNHQSHVQLVCCFVSVHTFMKYTDWPKPAPSVETLVAESFWQESFPVSAAQIWKLHWININCQNIYLIMLTFLSGYHMNLHIVD